MIKKLFRPFVMLLLASLCSCGSTEVKEMDSAKEKETAAPILKVFVENSGSMDGYMKDGSELRDAVYALATAMQGNCADTKLYYVNKETLPYRGDLQSFIRDLTPQAFAKAGGYRVASDIPEELDRVMKSANGDTVTMFVSDCMLALPNKVAADWLVNREIDMTNYVQHALKTDADFSVIVMKMSSKFDGGFYFNGAHHFKGIRPYFIWLMGNKYKLDRALKSFDLRESPHNYDQCIAFTQSAPVHFVATNQYGKSKKLKEKRGKYHILLRADLSSTLQPDDVLGNTGSYATTSDKVVVESVKPVKIKNKFTHTLSVTLDADGTGGEQYVTLKTPGVLPWVDGVNDAKGGNPLKTIGIKNLISGVSKAYKTDLTNMTFIIK